MPQHKPRRKCTIIISPLHILHSHSLKTRYVMSPTFVRMQQITAAIMIGRGSNVAYFGRNDWTHIAKRNRKISTADVGSRWGAHGIQPIDCRTTGLGKQLDCVRTGRFRPGVISFSRIRGSKLHDSAHGCFGPAGRLMTRDLVPLQISKTPSRSHGAQRTVVKCRRRSVGTESRAPSSASCLDRRRLLRHLCRHRAERPGTWHNNKSRPDVSMCQTLFPCIGLYVAPLSRQSRSRQPNLEPAVRKPAEQHRQLHSHSIPFTTLPPRSLFQLATCCITLFSILV